MIHPESSYSNTKTKNKIKYSLQTKRINSKRSNQMIIVAPPIQSLRLSEYIPRRQLLDCRLETSLQINPSFGNSI